MFIKKNISVLIICAMFFIGCTNENEPANKVLQTKSDRTKCLGDLPVQINKYFDGQSSRSEVNAFWTCVDDAFTLFRVYVKGKNRKAYTPQELRSFFHIFFLGDVRISDGLLLEIAHIKSLLFGGGIEQITDKELDQVVLLMNHFNDWTLELLPHIQIISRQVLKQSRFAPPTESEVFVATQALESVLQKMGQILGQSKINYDFVRLRSLLFELGQLFSDGGSSPRFADLDKLFPVLARVKLMLIGPNPTAIEPLDWVRLMNTVAGFSSSWIKMREAFDQRIWYRPAGLRLLIPSGSEILKILKQGIQQRPDNIIPVTELHSLLAELDEVIEFSRIIKIETLSSITDVLLKSFLGRPANEETTDLTLAKIDTMRRHWQSWIGVQQISTSFEERYMFAPPMVSRQKIINALANSEDGQIFNSAADFSSILSETNNIPVNLPQDRGYLITKRAYEKLSLESLGLLNLIRAALRMVVDAYGESGNGQPITQLTKDQFRTAYKDFKPLAIDLGLLQPGDDSLFEGLLIQADLFLGSSDGNQQISFLELTEFILVALNTVKVTELVNAELSRPEFCNAKVDANTYPTTCIKKLFVESDLQFLQLTPALRSFLLSQNTDSRLVVFKALQKISLGSDQTIQLDKMIEASIMLQFVEVLTLKFDSNNDGFISVGEARSQAYPLFSKALKDLLPFLPTDTQREAFFTYMLNFGEPPDPSLNPIHEIQFKHWIKYPQNWNFKADRKRLIEVLGALNSFT